MIEVPDPVEIEVPTSAEADEKHKRNLGALRDLRKILITDDSWEEQELAVADVVYSCGVQQDKWVGNAPLTNHQTVEWLLGQWVSVYNAGAQDSGRVWNTLVATTKGVYKQVEGEWDE